MLTDQREIGVSQIAELLETMASVPIRKRAITNLDLLNEAFSYAKPSSFSRGMRIDVNGLAILLISGTASIDENGRSAHIGDVRAQTRRTFSNITGLLESEGCSWHDVVRTSCYLRDIDRDYDAFNEERTAFYRELGLNPLPASTGIQAKLCRPELLIEIEAIALFRMEDAETGEAVQPPA
jgi:2-iminobutanoate/2-iminopropanoate deaminase